MKGKSNCNSNNCKIRFPVAILNITREYKKTSSPKGTDRSPEVSPQNILNSSQVKEFLNWSRAADFAGHRFIRPNFKIIRDYIVYLVTSKNEEGPIKNEGARVLTSLYVV